MLNWACASCNLALYSETFICIAWTLAADISLSSSVLIQLSTSDQLGVVITGGVKAGLVNPLVFIDEESKTGGTGIVTDILKSVIVGLLSKEKTGVTKSVIVPTEEKSTFTPAGLTGNTKLLGVTKVGKDWLYDDKTGAIKSVFIVSLSNTLFDI